MDLRRKWLAPIGVAALCGFASWLGIVLTDEYDRVAAIWMANGLLLGLLLIAGRPYRTSWLIAGAVGNLAANLISGDEPRLAVLLAACNTLEVLIAVVVAGASIQRAADLLKLDALWRFFLGALLVAPAVSAACAAPILYLLANAPLLPSFATWFAADSLGMAVITPLVLALRPREFATLLRAQHWLSIAWPFGVLILTSLAVFGQSTFPFLFMLLPPLLLVAFRYGFSGAAIGVFLIACIAFAFTVSGSGPFTLMSAAGTARVVALQCLLATTILTSYPICAVLAKQQELLNAIAASEQQLRAIAENSSDIIVLTDRDGVRRYISPAVEGLLGYKPDELVGTSGPAIVHPDDAPGFRAGLKRLGDGKDIVLGTFRLQRKDGAYVWVESSAKQLRDQATGRSRGWVSTIRDISARRRVDQLKDEFISTVSHELRTPLTSMLGALGLAASGTFEPGSPKFSRLIDMARSNGERLARLVNDILDFEKVSSGAMRFDYQELEVSELVNKSIATSQAYAEALGVSIKFHRHDTSRVRVDPGRFEQVMANLLSNAAKFSHRGGVVEVTSAVRDGRCVVSVRDYGIGIPAAFKASLFDRFSQADSSDQRTRGGTGLGMAIAKHMTERMGGSLTFESEEGAGTVFYVAFPIAETRAAAKTG